MNENEPTLADYNAACEIPSHLTLRTNAMPELRIFMTFTPDGRIELGKDVTPDEGIQAMLDAYPTVVEGIKRAAVDAYIKSHKDICG